MKYALFVIFEKASKLKLLLLQITGGALWVKLGQSVIKSNWKL